MSQKASGYKRQENELYPTPAWVVDALCEIIPLKDEPVWEPACGTCHMVDALIDKGARVTGTDSVWYPEMRKHEFTCMDFLEGDIQYASPAHIITNPPYGPRGTLAEQFIERSLSTVAFAHYVAMLLKVDFDSAKTRRKFFDECPDFYGKIVLTRRIKWFEHGTSGPSENHAWFIWKKGYQLHPRIFYAPRPIYAKCRRPAA